MMRAGMTVRLMAALASLAGIGAGLPRAEAKRALRQIGYKHSHASGGGIARELDLAGLPAFNEYRSPEELSLAGGGDLHASMYEQWATAHRQNRNRAKARRRELRA